MIELSVTVTRALELLSAQGMSDKSLHAYTHTGFGCIVRNGDGAKYYPCERCWKEGSEIVFLTEEGNRYHQTLNCSSLVRGIHAVRLWETGGLPPCSVCGG